MNDRRRVLLLALLCSIAVASPCLSQEADEEETEESTEEVMASGTFSGLKFRSIGPALMSGRIADFAVNPEDPKQYFVAVCSGGVWKTTNGGTTYQPVFDGEGSYSIGCVTLDPNNPNVVWVGTGENNSQRSVSFGDGVYRSLDGGKNWKNMGLKETEHIGMITIDPRDSDVVYVAAQGPLWRSGGDRGLYKTTDGGETWDRVLHISDDTGINEVHLDPRDPDVIYVSSYQRRRHVWTLINGGPESAIHKSIDGGASWRKLKSGIPGVDKGRIGLDISPANPDVIYAIVEAAQGKSGFFRSTNRGETWERRSDYRTTSAQYYNEIFCDPHDVDRVYIMDTLMKVTNDGGKTFKRVPRKNMHVDYHALWIDPDDTDHLLVGCDGGIYESYDLGAHWQYKPNLPVTQFYRVSTDNSEPFYYVYGGTQDNSSQGGPSRTRDRAGITNADWFITVGGDGYETQVDPEDSNIVYSLWQYGGLVRHDRRSGEITDIRPREKPGEEPYRWNWDSPLLISPHAAKRLYFAANRLFRSDDGGMSWQPISDDLTREIDRNTLQVMGRIQTFDAVAKHDSTSYYGNIVSLDESPLVEDLVYVGTDDGLVQVTGDAGGSWREVDTFAGVPDQTYVSCLTASRHEPDRVFAAFDNHKMGDFTPYLLRSDDRGETWDSIAGDLPERDIVYSIVEDHVRPDLLFAGTEFGVYFTIDGGERWIRLKSGVPTIAVRDIEIQRRENDLVLGTFGRSFYVLDDYTPLRSVTDDALEQEALLFPVKDAWRYVEMARLGGRNGKGSQGASYFAAANPPYGAVFTYYLKDKIQSRQEDRRKRQKDADKDDVVLPYPTYDEIRAEDEERAPRVILTVRDDAGEIVQHLKGPRGKGIHRVAWNLRYPPSTPVSVQSGGERSPWWEPPSGPLALPGTYTVTLSLERDGTLTPMGGPELFDVVPLQVATFAAADRDEVLAFQKKVARLQRAVRGALRAASEAENRLAHIRAAITETPAADPAMLEDVREVELRLKDLLIELRGDRTLGRMNEPRSPSIRGRVDSIVSEAWTVTSPPTQTQRDAYQYAGEAFGPLLAQLRELIESDITELEARLEELGAPWTPGRIPTWEME